MSERENYEVLSDPPHTSGTDQTPPNHPTQQPGTSQTSVGAPGDAGGPDLFSADSAPLAAPQEPPPDDYHPERGYVGATGGLGGGEAMGISTHRTTAGEPIQGREPQVTPEQWSGLTGAPETGPASAGGTPQELERSEPWRGSAAPEHEVGTTPGVAAAGPHGWPLSTGGAPTVTGGEDLRERDLPSSGQDEGEAPELGMAGEP